MLASAPLGGRRKQSPRAPGEMAERSKAHAWKACVGQPTVGSNPTLSAIESFFSEALCALVVESATLGVCGAMLRGARLCSQPETAGERGFRANLARKSLWRSPVVGSLPPPAGPAGD